MKQTKLWMLGIILGPQVFAEAFDAVVKAI